VKDPQAFPNTYDILFFDKFHIKYSHEVVIDNLFGSLIHIDKFIVNIVFIPCQKYLPLSWHATQKIYIKSSSLQ
jgi:hypothetical protein